MLSLLLLLAPALFAASIYMLLSRIIQVIDGEGHSLVKRRWLTKMFVAGDVISFFVQCGGGGIMAQGASTLTLGSNIVVSGLVIQLVSFGLFIIVAITFRLRINAQPTALSSSKEVAWLKHLVTLYIASALIMVRSTFRVVEYVQGNDGFLLGHEYFLYIFDAALMLGVMAIFNVVQPSEIKALLRGGNMIKNGVQLRVLNKQKPLEEYAVATKV